MNKIWIILLLFLSFSSCKKEQRLSVGESSPSYLSQLNTTHIIRPDSIRQLIRATYLEKEEPMVWDFVVTDYYTQQNSFMWLQSGTPQRIDTLLSFLDRAYRHGLNPELFSRTAIKEEIRRVKELDFEPGKSINHSLAMLEYSLTKAYMHYVCGMKYGFIMPHDLFNTNETDDGVLPYNVSDSGKKEMEILYEIPLERCTRAYAEEVFATLRSGDIHSTLQAVQPTSAYYTKMQEEMDKYMPLLHTSFDSIPGVGDLFLKEGDSHRAVPFIARRLLLTGELEANPADTTGQVLTAELIQAVNAFRVRNRLPEDNTIGSFTIRYLNNPTSYYVDRLQVNLERARWQYTQPKGKKYVLVNVAAFMLKAINEEVDSVLEMRICCGTVRNKTPLLSSHIGYMELNPYWNVPQSIIRKEMIPAYRRDSTYFTRHRMKIYDLRGNQVNPHDVKWSNYTKNVPFLVKQDNGAGNSLGRIIFRFPNSFAVYLHDTPVRSAFLRTNRAVSHGCVRLEKALDFAFFLLDKPDAVLEDRIRVAMGLRAQSEEGKKETGQETYKELRYYHLKEQIPLFIDYQTTYLSADNTLSYCEDTYKYDRTILDALEQLNSPYATNER